MAAQPSASGCWRSGTATSTRYRVDGVLAAMNRSRDSYAALLIMDALYATTSRADIVAKTAAFRVGAGSTRTKGEIRDDTAACALRARRCRGCVPGVWGRRAAKTAQPALYRSTAPV